MTRPTGNSLRNCNVIAWVGFILIGCLSIVLPVPLIGSKGPFVVCRGKTELCACAQCIATFWGSGGNEGDVHAHFWNEKR